ncbi:MAG: hypothetical protein KUA43_08890 [Hoeflea sp.]|uniref:hypothetical protein n=1 Tax=Hoeflea sp. TaxID=1940281 RepID=UPI001D610DCC|nr:hypothetical protein [Hoeflea sp.]MBU4529781.1 hypothetical protein [Alphaproteobacteria bacterium]MBU4543342.1 hypothetical protein [Alphaproteobacteria bacterium]MBU4552529.1 hypothetical protein [Alphaproteobacteria bacterium]MBV1723545.1 hypothetical protein [Hoeflea sp.]MBV1762994.1 hypothetical protein [Hoeflea sp.]
MARKRITLAGSRRKGEAPQRIYRGDARKEMIRRVMDLLRNWRLSPFEHEGATRTGFRTALVMEGHGWQAADDEAAALIAESFRLLGAVRPTWLQGQREYSAGHEYCLGCRGPLDEEAMTNGWRFCCDECARVTRNHRPEIYQFAVSMARSAAFYAASKEKIPERACAWCGTSFKPATLQTVTCSHACAGRVRTDAVPERNCLACGKRFRGRSIKSKLCSIQCIRDHDRASLPKRPCDLCGELFQPATTFNRFCSTQHRARANHLKKKEKATSAFICEEVAEFRDAAE